MRILLTQNAERDLQAIEDYIGQDNPLAAIDTVLRVLDSIRHLSDHPSMGHEGRVPGTFEWVIPETSFIAPYRIRGHVIEILRILHTSREWPRQL